MKHKSKVVCLECWRAKRRCDRCTTKAIYAKRRVAEQRAIWQRIASLLDEEHEARIQPATLMIGDQTIRATVAFKPAKSRARAKRFL